MADPIIPRKWKLRAHDQHNVFVWGNQERSTHTLLKAFIWALYLPDYPHMSVEVRIGDRYKPDVVAFSGDAIAPTAVHTVMETPLFWGEAGAIGRTKIHNLVRKYPTTHFVIAKWNKSIKPTEKLVCQELKGVNRTAPYDIISFASDSHSQFIDNDGNITLSHNDLDWVRL